MTANSELRTRLRKHLPEEVLTDDIAYDDIVCASGELTVLLQKVVDVYNLTAPQLQAALKVALEDVKPDERLCAAIDGGSSLEEQ